jgi:hypothetical protein
MIGDVEISRFFFSRVIVSLLIVNSLSFFPQRLIPQYISTSGGDGRSAGHDWTEARCDSVWTLRTTTEHGWKFGHSQGFRKQICAFWSPGVSLQNLQNLPRDFQTWRINPKGQPNFIVSSHFGSLLHLSLHSPSKHSSNIIAWIAVMYFTLSVSLRRGYTNNDTLPEWRIQALYLGSQSFNRPNRQPKSALPREKTYIH